MAAWLACALVVGQTPRLQVNARGMACAKWSGGAGPAPGIGQDCVFDTLPGSTQHEGSPYIGFLDSNTGVCSSVPGVSEVVSDFAGLHGTFVSPDPAAHVAVGYGLVNYSYSYVSFTLPLASKKGSVRVLGYPQS